MASRSLGSATIDVIANTGGFEQGMDRVERKAAGAQARVSKDAKQNARDTDKAWRQAADNIDRSFEDLGKKIGLAATVAGGAVAAMVASTTNAAQEIVNLSQISGASAVEFQKFAVAAKTVGIEQDKLADIFKDFREKVGEFVQTGGGGMKDFFEQIAPKVGITADAFRNLSGPQALQLYVDSLEKAGLSQEQMSFYLESMASDTTALIPLLRDGGAALDDLGNAASRTGQILDDQAIKAAVDFNRQMDEMSGILAGVRNEIFSELIPGVSGLAGEFLKVARDVGVAQAALITFGGVAARALKLDDAGSLMRQIDVVSKQVDEASRRLDSSQNSFLPWSKSNADAARRDLEDLLKVRSRLSEQLKQLVAPPSPVSASASPAVTSIVSQAVSRSPWVPPVKEAKGKKEKEKFTLVGPLPDAGGSVEKYLALEKEAEQLRKSLMTDREKQIELEQRYQEMLDAGMISQEQFNKASADLVEKGYWDEWLESAEKALSNFDEISKSVTESFTSQFGSAFESMIFESKSLGDAVQGMAQGMARTVINVIGQMAAQWIAAEAIKRLTSQQTTAAVVAGTAAQTTAAVAANATAATSAAATGASIATSMAPAAATTSLATLGANSIPAIAGIMAALALIPLLSGSRATGGQVGKGKLYEINENHPEVLSFGGKDFLMMGDQDGSVSNQYPKSSGQKSAIGGDTNVSVNLIEDRSKAGRVVRREGQNGSEIDVFVSDIMGDGPRSRAMQSAFGLRRVGA